MWPYVFTSPAKFPNRRSTKARIIPTAFVCTSEHLASQISTIINTRSCLPMVYVHCYDTWRDTWPDGVTAGFTSSPEHTDFRATTTPTNQIWSYGGGRCYYAASLEPSARRRTSLLHSLLSVSDHRLEHPALELEGSTPSVPNDYWWGAMSGGSGHDKAKHLCLLCSANVPCAQKYRQFRVSRIQRRVPV